MSLEQEAITVLTEAVAGTSSHHEASSSNYQSYPVAQRSKDDCRPTVNSLTQITENDESPANSKHNNAVRVATPSKNSVSL